MLGQGWLRRLRHPLRKWMPKMDEGLRRPLVGAGCSHRHCPCSTGPYSTGALPVRLVGSPLLLPGRCRPNISRSPRRYQSHGTLPCNTSGTCTRISRKVALHPSTSPRRLPRHPRWSPRLPSSLRRWISPSLVWRGQTAVRNRGKPGIAGRTGRRQGPNDRFGPNLDPKGSSRSSRFIEVSVCVCVCGCSD